MIRQRESIYFPIVIERADTIYPPFHNSFYNPPIEREEQRRTRGIL